jgi:20S proteasome subunit alpha 2
VSLLICGYDETKGPTLYQVDPSGSFWAWKASAIGKNQNNAKTFLEKRCARLLTPDLRLKRGRRYNDEISLEDAIHTALLTLKEGFEGQMTEKTIEIGIIGIPSATEQSDMARVHGTDENAVALPVFRKLSEAAIKDYLAL